MMPRTGQDMPFTVHQERCTEYLSSVFNISRALASPHHIERVKPCSREKALIVGLRTIVESSG